MDELHPHANRESPPDMAGMAENASSASQLLRALANEGRLLLLCALVEGEKNVGELEDGLGFSQPYVSQQLARLRREGLVAARRDGRVIHYRLADARVTPVLVALHDAFCAGPG